MPPTIRFELDEFEAAENYVKKVLNVIDSNENLEFRATGLEIMAFLNMEKEKFRESRKIDVPSTFDTGAVRSNR